MIALCFGSVPGLGFALRLTSELVMKLALELYLELALGLAQGFVFGGPGFSPAVTARQQTGFSR
jgi:hypothetical protein